MGAAWWLATEMAGHRWPELFLKPFLIPHKIICCLPALFCVQTPVWRQLRRVCDRSPQIAPRRLVETIEQVERLQHKVEELQERNTETHQREVQLEERVAWLEQVVAQMQEQQQVAPGTRQL